MRLSRPAVWCHAAVNRTRETPSVPLPRATNRVLLRRLVPGDLAAFQAYRHDQAVGRYQDWRPQPDAQAAAFLQRMNGAPLFAAGEWVQLGIALRDTGLLIGDLGWCIRAPETEAEIGFTLSAPSQGRGLGTEAVLAAIALLFERTPIARVVAITDARNSTASNLLERVGMRRIATRDAVFRGRACREHTYALSRSAEPSLSPGFPSGRASNTP